MFAKMADHQQGDYSPWFPKLVSPKMNVWLTRIPTESEVKNALDAISEDKAPGSDRFTMRIFKVLWNFIKFNLVASLTHLFLAGVW